jgi:DNA-binding NarL/FixJ family response regulator
MINPIHTHASAAVSAPGSGNAPIPATRALPGSIALTPNVREIWDALALDSGADVCVLDGDGRLLYVAPLCSWWEKGLSDQSAVGRTMHDLIDREKADERLAIVHLVLKTNRPVVSYSIWRGIRTRSVFRPLVDEARVAKVVMVLTRGIVPADEARPESLEHEVVTIRHEDRGELARLTPREIEILSYIARGLTTQRIADILGRSRKTIEAHRLALGSKLNARNRVELARIAIDAGLIAPDSAVTDVDAGIAKFD